MTDPVYPKPQSVCEKCGADWRYEFNGKAYSHRIAIYD